MVKMGTVQWLLVVLLCANVDVLVSSTGEQLLMHLYYAKNFMQLQYARSSRSPTPVVCTSSD